MPVRLRGILARVLVISLLLSLVPGLVLAHENHPLTSARRLAGEDRLETAGLVAESAFASAPDVLLARADTFPDSLSGSALAGALNAPVLLVPTDGDLPEAATDALERLDTERVTLLGGTAAISDGTADALDQAGYEVDRIEGADRFATAAAVARRLGVAPAHQGRRTVLLANGATFADGLTVAPLAYDARLPVLLTGRDVLPEVTRAVLAELDVEQVLVAGGPAAVSEGVTTELTDGGMTVTRYSGATRVETAVDVANAAVTSFGFTATHANIARGDDFPDALALGPHAGAERAPVLLTAGPHSLGGGALEGWLQEHACELDALDVAGGSAAVDDDRVADLRAAATGHDGCEKPAPEPSATPSPSPSPSATPGGSGAGSSGDGSLEGDSGPAATGQPRLRAVATPAEVAVGEVIALDVSVSVDDAPSANRPVQLTTTRADGVASSRPSSLRLSTDSSGRVHFTTMAASPGLLRLTGCLGQRCAGATVRITSAGAEGGDPATASGRCDPIVPSSGDRCLLPFPNDHYTVRDAASPTGRRVNLSVLATPRNGQGPAGVPIEPTEQNRNDGFSPGALIIAGTFDIDLALTGAAPLTDLARSIEPDAPITIVDTTTGARHPFWAEIDATPGLDEADRALLLRPARNFVEGHRYVVAMRRLRRSDGTFLEPSPAFAALRAGTAGSSTEVAGRVAHFEELFASLGAVGIGRADLVLAWDFTVASAESIAGRMLHIRDDAFAELDDQSPEFRVDSVEELDDPEVARRVKGTITAPSYLTTPIGSVGDGDASGSPGTPGSRFFYEPTDGEDPVYGDGLPDRLGGVATQDFTFTCNVPRVAFAGDGSPTRPARPALYGHGLLGGQGEVQAGNVEAMGAEHDFSFCATDWIGMSTADVPNVGVILADMSNFPTLADRVQQGILHFLLLGRAMIHPDGFTSDPAFQDVDGTPLLDTSELYYDGNSQGGIIGGALMAVSQDATKGVLGVPGMNYSTLLDRSVDFGTYEVPFEAAYTDPVERQLVFSLIQMLWDRAEADGYAQHMTDDPYPGTPAHRILLHPALGDHQVANAAAEVQARTIGAAVRVDPVGPGRSLDVEPFWDVERIDAYPYEGSAIELWDSGSPVPPASNVPPSEGEDPHGHPRSAALAREQKTAFLAPDSAVVDVCGGPCVIEP